MIPKNITTAIKWIGLKINKHNNAIKIMNPTKHIKNCRLN